MVTRAGLLCIGMAVAVSAQQDPMQLVNQIRQKVTDGISHLPRYMCMETVDRIDLLPDKFAHGPKEKLCPDILAASEFKDKKPQGQVFSTDRLRLDVAVSDNSEMYSWVGEEKFGDEGLGERVKHGATSTGSFSSYLQSIFVGSGASFSFKGESQRNGRRVLVYGLVFRCRKADIQSATSVLAGSPAITARFGQTPRPSIC